MTEEHPSELQLLHEEEVRKLLIERYRASYADRVHHEVDVLMALDHYAARFAYLRSVLKDELDFMRRLLVSGCSSASEMIVARNQGFREIHGVEVEMPLLRIGRLRLSGVPGMHPLLYDGARLPYRDSSFDLLLSGHIIEHTYSPQQYLRECMRVIRRGGILYLEFPTRYNLREMHTGLFSFEWLPTPLRNLMIRIMASRFSPLNELHKGWYESFITTGLRQVSRRDIFRWLRQLGIGFREVAYSVPDPGIIRTILRKEG